MNAPVYDRWGVKVFHGDSLHVLREWPDECVDSIVCDPQYGLSDIESDQVVAAMLAWAQGDRERVPDAKGFMGAAWDGFVPPPAIWDECYRVLKPGGHLAAFTAARNVDIAGLAIRMAGFRIRDDLSAWIYSQGMPKGQDISKAIDKARDEDASPRAAVARALRDALSASGRSRRDIDDHFGTANVSQYWFSPDRNAQVPPVERWPWVRDFLGIGPELDAEVWRLNGRKGTWGNERADRVVALPSANRVLSPTQGVKHRGTPVLDEAARWQGWNTQLAPAHEPILLARKPVSERTVAANVVRHGTGALNIAATKVGDEGGRFPTNLLFCHHPDCGTDENPRSCVDGCSVRELDRQAPDLKSGANPTRRGADKFRDTYGAFAGQEECVAARGADEGSASRFFPIFRYEAKAPKTERPMVDGQVWTTVKPTALMRWLIRMLTPPGGTVLDWCCGSGSTGQAARAEGFNAVLIDKDPTAIKLTTARLDARPRTEAPVEPGTAPAPADDHVHDLLDLLGGDAS